MAQKKKNRILVYLLFLSYILYFLQGGLYDRGSFIPRISVVIILIIDLFYAIKVYSFKPTRVSNAVIAFLFLLTASWLLSPKYVFVVDEMSATLGELKNSFVFLMAYFPFRWWTITDTIDERLMRKIAVSFFVLYIIGYAIKQYETITTEFWRENVTNNGGYMIPLVFPLLSLFLREKKIWLFAGLSMILVLVSAKRGAIACMGLECVALFFFKIKEVRAKSILWVFIAFTVLVIVAYQFIESNDFLLDRFQSDSSGRDDIYQRAIDVFKSGDLAQKVLGYGFCQSIVQNYMYAHSDWFELLVDNGVVGIFLYLLIFYSLFITYVKKIKHMSNEYKLMFVSASICWFAKSLFSMGYNSPEACMLMIAIGLSEGNDLFKIQRG